MNETRKRFLVEQYLSFYNAFDIEGMISVAHPRIMFQNISAGQITATAEGLDAFRRLAEASKHRFSSRKQTLTGFVLHRNGASADVSFEAVLADDLENGMKKGDRITRQGWAEFIFRDNKISSILDIV